MRNRQYNNVGASQTGQRASFITAVEMHLVHPVRTFVGEKAHPKLHVLVTKQVATCSRRRFFAVIFIAGPTVV